MMFSEYAKKYTNIPVSTLGTKMEFYTNLYKHDQYGRMGKQLEQLMK